MRVIRSGSRTALYSDDLQTFDKIPAGYYSISYSQMGGWALEDAPELSISEKVYGVNGEKVDKVIRSFERAHKNLGVILSGDKGIGKSLTAKMIAIKAESIGYPVIIVSSYIPGVADYINSIEQEVVCLFDEFDKTFGVQAKDSDTAVDPQTEMLSLFDGMSSGKKLFIITCNELRNVSSYLVNRPGRFHYHFRFDYPDKVGITEYLTDKGIAEGEIKKVIEFSHKVKLNYDCLHAIAFELEDGSHFEDVINDLNIINLSAQKYNITLYFTDGTVLRDSACFDLFSDEEDQMGFHQNGDGYDYVGWLSFIPNMVKFIGSTECLVPADCKWELDTDVLSVAHAKEEDGYSPEEINNAKKWLNRKIDHAEFRLSDSNRYTYTV